MTPILPDKTGAYFCRNKVIDYVYFWGGRGTAIERVARLLNCDQSSVKVVSDYSKLRKDSHAKREFKNQETDLLES